MVDNTYLGLPRKEIQWHPKIDYNLCTNCGICLEKCDHKVYLKEGDRIVVAQPLECLVSCESCRYRCPVGAISFPSRVELKQVLRTVREKYGYG